jgi:hypothetical protein
MPAYLLFDLKHAVGDELVVILNLLLHKRALLLEHREHFLRRRRLLLLRGLLLLHSCSSWEGLFAGLALRSLLRLSLCPGHLL